MKVQQILSSVFLIALVLPVGVHAEIFKWKDRNGVTIYSDMPPPANVNARSFGESGKDTSARPEPAAPVETKGGQAKIAVEKDGDGKAAPTKSEAPIEDPKLQAKRAAAKKAEMEKKNKQVKEEQAKIEAENCIAAKANYQQYAQGGRVFKMNEKGEREYMDDAGLATGKRQAQAQIQKYCK